MVKYSQQINWLKMVLVHRLSMMAFFMPYLRRSELLGLVLCCGLLTVANSSVAQLKETVAQEGKIILTKAQLNTTTEGVVVDAVYKIDLPKSLQEAVQRSVPLYFTTDFDMSKKRWYWIDGNLVSKKRTMKINFAPITQEYRVYTGGLFVRFNALSDALSFVGKVRNWVVIERNDVGKLGLNPGRYQAELQMRLDTSLLPKPLQVHALNSTDWNLESEPYELRYDAE